MKKKWVTWLIIFSVILLGFVINMRSHPETSEEVAKCIGKNSVIYVQYECSHCKDQEELFGDNYQYLSVVDCFFELDKCEGITGTPTWVIDGQKYMGVQSIEKLKELTGC